MGARRGTPGGRMQPYKGAGGARRPHPSTQKTQNPTPSGVVTEKRFLYPVRGLSEHSIIIRGGSTRSTGAVVRFPGERGARGGVENRRFRRAFRVSDRPGGENRDFRTCSQLARISSRPSSAFFGRKRRLFPLPFEHLASRVVFARSTTRRPMGTKNYYTSKQT